MSHTLIRRPHRSVGESGPSHFVSDALTSEPVSSSSRHQGHSQSSSVPPQQRRSISDTCTDIAQVARFESAPTNSATTNEIVISIQRPSLEPSPAQNSKSVPIDTPTYPAVEVVSPRSSGSVQSPLSPRGDEAKRQVDESVRAISTGEGYPKRTVQIDPEGRPNVRFRRNAFSPPSPTATEFIPNGLVQHTQTTNENVDPITEPLDGGRIPGTAHSVLSTEIPQLNAISANVGCPNLECWDDEAYFGRRRSKKKLYVGRYRTFPCPQHLVSEWEKNIFPRLMSDLAAASSWCSPDEFFEAELRMAGHRARKQKTVQLSPTVCIRCTSKGCRKDFKKAVKDLDYLTTFCFGRVEVKLGAPRLAATETEVRSSPEYREPRDPFTKEQGNLRQEYMLQRWSHGGSACGLKFKTVTETPETHIESVSTIGGLIKVENKIYGLTTGHGIIAPPRPSLSKPSCAYSSDSSTDESDNESLYDSDASSNDESPQPSRRKSAVSIPSQWTPISSTGPACFCGQSEPLAPVNDDLEPNNSDFALIDMGLSRSSHLFNQYKTFHGRALLFSTSIDYIRYDTGTVSGRVLLLIDQDRPSEGYLLKGTTVFRSKAASFQTRKIELKQPLPKGVSGTWVVQDDRLCGIIVAVYEMEPYVHMITVDKMFRDIRSTLKVKNVTLAREEDISSIYHGSNALGPSELVCQVERKRNPQSIENSKEPLPPLQVESARTSGELTTRDNAQTSTTPPSSRSPAPSQDYQPRHCGSSDSGWTRSDERNDYYTPEHRPDGMIVGYTWASPTIPWDARPIAIPEIAPSLGGLQPLHIIISEQQMEQENDTERLVLCGNSDHVLSDNVGGNSFDVTGSERPGHAAGGQDSSATQNPSSVQRDQISSRSQITEARSYSMPQEPYRSTQRAQTYNAQSYSSYAPSIQYQPSQQSQNSQTYTSPAEPRDRHEHPNLSFPKH